MPEQPRIVELTKNSSLPILEYRHNVDSYYDVNILHDAKTWTFKLTLKTLDEPMEKKDQSRLFESYIEEPKVFAAEIAGEKVGWIELGYQGWNSRMRVGEFLVKEGFRGKGVGRLLMNRAVEVAKQRSARMLVLETQSWNVRAINFYVNYGFELIGLDTHAYSNQDIENKDVGFEFGLRLQAV